nr:Mur ligase family protein [Candidatus Competibacteraceae bacterium]
MSPIVTIDQALALLETLSRHRTLPPDPPRPPPQQRLLGELLTRLGDPQRDLQVIHIAGSKGKGSVALLIESILTAAGLSTGTFTSPHLQRWTERLRLNGREITPGTLVTLLEKLRPQLEILWQIRPQEPLSCFDTLTAGALTLFREHQVDYALVEAGMGGRLDATNVVSPRVTCLTTVELEHTEQLGPTLTAITREKAGIIKAGVPLITGRLPRAAARVVASRARACSAPWLQLGEAFDVTVSSQDQTGQEIAIAYQDQRVTCRLPLAGRHQAVNAALAAVCVAQLGCLNPAAWARAVAQGLAGVMLPGRVQFLSRRPWIVADGAHTRASSRALVQALATLPVRHVRLLLSASSHEHLQAVCPQLLPLADRVIITRADPHRCLPTAAVADHIHRQRPDLAVLTLEDPRAALLEAAQGLEEDELLLATGSVYLAGLLGTHPLPQAPLGHPIHPQPDEVQQ